MSIKKELLKVGRIPSQLFRRVAPPFLQPVSINCGKKLSGTKFILIACMPKSGSTFLASTLGGLPNFRLGSAVPGLGRREQEIDEGSLIKSAEITKNTVFQHHVCHSEPLERLLQKYPFHVVVLSRDLRDAAASFSDHLDRESTDTPMAYCDSDDLQNIDSSGKRLDFIVDMILPWYVKFYVSWQKYRARGGSVQFMTFDHLIENKLESIRSILEQAGLRISEADVIESVNSDRFTRLNKGVSGRGDALFNDNPQATANLQRYLSYYPDVDFRPIFRI